MEQDTVVALSLRHVASAMGTSRTGGGQPLQEVGGLSEEVWARKAEKSGEKLW